MSRAPRHARTRTRTHAWQRALAVSAAHQKAPSASAPAAALCAPRAHALQRVSRGGGAGRAGAAPLPGPVALPCVPRPACPSLLHAQQRPLAAPTHLPTRTPAGSGAVCSARASPPPPSRIRPRSGGAAGFGGADPGRVLLARLQAGRWLPSPRSVRAAPNDTHN
ncbi:MAG: hypothetical protein J3K34DRAFT_425166 [Monoraphidium minutum]|nr:MAG: hypothetical protein J3K34DRAFT_425166 [Monoraphidium minutum]